MKHAIHNQSDITRESNPCLTVRGGNAKSDQVKPEILAIARLLARVAVDEYVDSVIKSRQP